MILTTRNTRADVKRLVNVYSKELQRRARFANHHLFNLRCLKSSIIPTSLRIKSPVSTNRAQAAASRVSRIFLQERVKTSQKVKNNATLATDDYRTQLQNIMSTEDFATTERICKNTAEKTFQRFKERQSRKFSQLRSRQETNCLPVRNGREQWVVNLSDYILSTHEQAVLAKGPRFAVTPSIKTIDFAAPIETALQISKATEQDKETVRVKVCEILKRARKPADNLSKDERKAIKAIRENDKIRILKADKGNATVVLNATDYDEKVRDLLDVQAAYKLLKKDPTRTIERNTLKLLRELKNQAAIDRTFYDSVRPSEGSSTPARFYGRIKLHKQLAPLRPVVATQGTATYRLARRLSRILRPLVGTSGRVLKNTKDLIDTMRNVKIEDDEVLVSYDVKSLFTNVPVNESIDVCERRLREDGSLQERTELSVETIIQLLRLCLTSTSFIYGGKHYQQIDGLAMGSPVSSVVADIFMEEFETKAFSAYNNTPRLWRRFVDDVLAIVKRSSARELLAYLNDQHVRIQFTMEEEMNGSLPFMDVKFNREVHGGLETEVYQKPTHTNRYIQFDSHQPMQVKSSVVRCLTNRALVISSSGEKRSKELNKIKKVMANNGYPRKFVSRAMAKQIKQYELPDTDRKRSETGGEVLASIPFVDGISQEVRRIVREAGVKCVFSADSTLESLYCNKDPLPKDMEKNVIYTIKCGTCDEEYVGETKRSLATRIKEHQDATRSDQCSKSAVAEHAHEHDIPHNIDWESAKVIDRGKSKFNIERKMREAFHIHLRQPGMNRDHGVERSATWNAVL